MSAQSFFFSLTLPSCSRFQWRIRTGKFWGCVFCLIVERESLLSFSHGHGPPSAAGLTHQRLPIPTRNIRPTLTVRRIVDAFVYAERFVAPSRLEGAPTMTGGINASGEWLDRVTQAFETIGSRMERARFTRRPSNNDLSTPVAETGDAAWKVGGEALLAR